MAAKAQTLPKSVATYSSIKTSVNYNRSNTALKQKQKKTKAEKVINKQHSLTPLGKVILSLLIKNKQHSLTETSNYKTKKIYTKKHSN